MKLRYLSFLFLLSSCAYFVNQFDSNRLSQDIVSLKGENKTLFCPADEKIQLANSTLENQIAFKRFIDRISKSVSLSFHDQVALWSLVQMNLRPDQVSPSSKLQVFLKTGSSYKYYHFYSKNSESFPYIAGIERILKIGKSTNSIYKLADYVDRLFPEVFVVGKNFETFLDENKIAISKNKTLKSHYMRADETLKENEKIPKYNLKSIISDYKKNKRYKDLEVSTSLFSYVNQTSTLTAHCNYDMRLYSNSVYLIHNQFIKSQIFGMKTSRGSFLASSGQRLEGVRPIGNSIFFKGVSQTRSAAFCAFEYPKSAKTLWLASTDSRDPGQHIYHLIEYGLDEVNSKASLSALLEFSRHLFLEDPTRLVFESNRSSKEQLDRLLKLNLPVYNARNLGNMWGYYSNGKENSFVIDDRGDGTLQCYKK